MGDLKVGGVTPDNIMYSDQQVDRVYYSGNLIWEHIVAIPGFIGDTAIVEVTNPITGRVWMDRNIGATRAATSSTDTEAYGHLFQWGRGADGHQLRTSDYTLTLSSTDIPGHDDFIVAQNSPYDWRSPQNDNLWQGIIQDGWRLPTETEWEAEKATWGSSAGDGGILKLTRAGSHPYDSSNVTLSNFFGFYWASTINGSDAKALFFAPSDDTDIFNYHRGNGYSVRLIKDV